MEAPLTYIRSLKLPETPPLFESASDPLGEAADAPALVVGSQLAEFGKELVADVRNAVADSLLNAQLAANRAADQTAQVFDWYRKYVEVLQGIGWRSASLSFETQQLSDRNADVHQAILPVITAMLGPPAASLVVSVLKGLQEMDRSRPWIALFARASQHASGAKFQISRVDANESGDLGIDTLCFSIEAKRALTQILFFRFTENDARFQKGQGRLSMSKARLMETRGPIAERVRPLVAEYVRSIEI